MNTINKRAQVLFVNESGMYSLVLSSKLEQAKKVKRWITSEVLPAIRKTGKYQLQPQQLALPEPEKKFTFEFSGPSLEAVLDRLPTAKVIKTQGKVHTITAECYGDGIKMWLNSQGDNVKIIEEREI